MIALVPAVRQIRDIYAAAVAHVMAQISHECGAGGEVFENLNTRQFGCLAVAFSERSGGSILRRHLEGACR